MIVNHLNWLFLIQTNGDNPYSLSSCYNKIYEEGIKILPAPTNCPLRVDAGLFWIHSID